MDKEIQELLKHGPVRVLLTNGLFVDIIDRIGDWCKYQYLYKRTKTGLVKTYEIQAIQPRFDNIIAEW